MDWIGGSLSHPSVTKSAIGSIAGRELFHYIEGSLNDRHEHHLCNPIPSLYGESGLASIPQGNHQRALIVGID